MLAGTLLDNITAVVLEIEKRSWALTTLFFAHTFLSNFTLLNMLVGIIVQVSPSDFEKPSWLCIPVATGNVPL